jgi:long-subunit acyl-CoA synthetase (AMP-forming)
MSDSDWLALDYAYHWEKVLPDRIYLTQPLGGGQVQTYTWKEAMDQVRRMAAHLESLDLPANSNIAIFSKNAAHWIMADLAIWMAGHVSVTLFPTLGSDRVRYILDHSESKLILIGQLDVWDEARAGIPDGLPKIALPLSSGNGFSKWDDLVAEQEPLRDSPVRQADELATIVYTSGTTGQPKGVMLSFGLMARTARGLRIMITSTTEDRMLSYLPLAHAFERWGVEMNSLVSGFQLFFTESLETFVADLRRARPTLFMSVPRLWQKFQAGVLSKVPQRRLSLLLKIPIASGLIKKQILTELGLRHTRIACSGSAPSPGSIIRWYRNLGLELLEGYGMTENFCFSHMNRPGQTRLGYVGHAHVGVETKINDEGEILVKSPGNMMGYYREPGLSREAFTEDGFLRTGDRGQIDDQGRLRITGRTKELFKTSKGKYIAPAVIENKLLVHPDIEQACVSGSGFPQPHALICPTPEARKRISDPAEKETIEASLLAHLTSVNSTLEHHEVVQFFVVVKDDWTIENGFLTPTEKIRRAVLEETYGPTTHSWYGSGDKVIWQS